MIDRIHGGNCSRREIIDFSVNTNPLGLPEGLVDIISKKTDFVLRYPDPSSDRLRRKISISDDVTPENIAVGNGSIELIYLIPRAFKIRKPLIITPTFSEYEFAVRSNGSRPAFFNTSEKDNFKVDCGKLAKCLPRHDALFLCNPNNPTGTLLHSDDVVYLSRFLKKRRGFLVLDEAFIGFTGQAKSKAVISEAVNNGSVVIIRSLTKLFAIPGLRLGYVIGRRDTVDKITKLQYPWNVNGPAQIAGETIIADRAYVDRTRLFVSRERQYMAERLSNIKGLKAYPPSANFILCKLEKAPIRGASELTRRLLREGIYIRDCGNFRGLGDKFFRVAVRKRDDNDRLIKSIEKVFK
jgi:threonine-phosphate decarboxylase